MIFLRLI